jgi:hypothetical protein
MYKDINERYRRRRKNRKATIIAKNKSSPLRIPRKVL